MLLFDQVYAFEFIDKNSPNAVRITELNMSFEIEKNLTELPNEARFTIRNMNKQNRDLIEQPEIYCSLVAGHDGQPLPIFKGVITDAYSYRDRGNTNVTEIEVRDGFLEWRDEITSVSFSPHVPKAASLKKNANMNSTAKNILQYIANDMKLPITFEEGVEDYLFKQGFSYYGAAREALARVCKAAGYRWSIQSSVIRILPPIWSITDSGILLNSLSGMVGSPERLRRSAKQSAKVKDEETGKKVQVQTARPKFDGWRVTTLLRPELEPGDYFIVESMYAPFTQGKTLKASKVRHQGTYQTTQWLTQVEADEQEA
jgi:hypothetical protein